MAKQKFFIDEETGMRNDERTRDLQFTSFGDSLSELIENGIIIERCHNDDEVVGDPFGEYSDKVQDRCMELIEEEIVKTAQERPLRALKMLVWEHLGERKQRKGAVHERGP